MILTSFSSFLNTFFASYDRTILQALHSLAEAAGGFLTPVMRFLTWFGEHGISMFLLSAVLLCFPKTRRAGVCVFGAVCCGALITNITLKDLVARPRPFQASELYASWWQFVGAPEETDFSFPSGHATSAMAGALALILASPWKKRFTSCSLLYVFFLAVSRNYLCAHYPSDVLAGLLIGAFSAAIAYGITLLIFAFLEKYRRVPFFDWILVFDIRHPFSYRSSAEH